MAVAQQPAVAIVDDDPGISRSLSSLLAVSGHRVQTFVSAVEFQKADIRVFACLILDYHMPEMTGLHLAEWLRGEGSPIPIMLVTGLPSSTITARAAELGIERVLEKPPNERDLLGFIASSLRQRELDE